MVCDCIHNFRDEKGREKSNEIHKSRRLPPMKATLIATAKSEGPFLLEWVAYHRVIGFTDILIYENGSDDGGRRILRELNKIGAVRFFRNENPPKNYQIRAYTRASEEPEFQQADWVIALDLDEFFVVKTGTGTVQDYVRALPDCDGAMVNWRLFGSGGHALPNGDLVTERFVRAEPADEIAEDIKAVKTLFRPHLFQRCGVHLPRLMDEPTQEPRFVNGSGLAEGAFKQTNYRTNDPDQQRLAQINHYAVRDAASFLLKTFRGSAHQDHRSIGTRYWNTRDRNESEDRSAHQHLEATRAEMAALNAQTEGVLGDLTAMALERRLRKIETLLEDGEARARYLYYLGRR